MCRAIDAIAMLWLLCLSVCTSVCLFVTVVHFFEVVRILANFFTNSQSTILVSRFSYNKYHSKILNHSHCRGQYRLGIEILSLVAGKPCKAPYYYETSLRINSHRLANFHFFCRRAFTALPIKHCRAPQKNHT